VIGDARTDRVRDDNSQMNGSSSFMPHINRHD